MDQPAVGQVVWLRSNPNQRMTVSEFEPGSGGTATRWVKAQWFDTQGTLHTARFDGAQLGWVRPPEKKADLAYSVVPGRARNASCPSAVGVENITQLLATSLKGLDLSPLVSGGLTCKDCQWAALDLLEKLQDMLAKESGYDVPAWSTKRRFRCVEVPANDLYGFVLGQRYYADETLEDVVPGRPRSLVMRRYDGGPFVAVLTEPEVESCLVEV
jgi:hypothetical protein